MPTLFRKLWRDERGFSLTELMIVLVIIGILVGVVAIPKYINMTTKAKATEAKKILEQIYILEKSYALENDKYTNSFGDIGFEQTQLITEGGMARYRIAIVSADDRSFKATATSVVDFNKDGTFNVWSVDETGKVKQDVPD
jgi:type IV pilus assembly protein PilE